MLIYSINLGSAGGGSGTVTSVTLTAPAFLTVTGSPVTTSGSIDLTFSGTAIPIANGGTNATTANSAFNNLAPSQATNSGKFLTTDGTNTSWATVSGGGITGPGSSTDNAMVRWDGTGGTAVQNGSHFIMSDAGLITFAPVSAAAGAIGFDYSGAGLTGTWSNLSNMTGAFPSGGDAYVDSMNVSFPTSTGRNYVGRDTRVHGGGPLVMTSGWLAANYDSVFGANTGNTLGAFTVSPLGNFGILSQVTNSAVGGALAVGHMASVHTSQYQFGGVFQAVNNSSASGTSVGVQAIATRELGALGVAVYGKIYSATSAAVEASVPSVSAAAIFDNGDTTSDILRLHDNNSMVTQISDGGSVIMNSNASNANGHRYTFDSSGVAIGNGVYNAVFNLGNFAGAIPAGVYIGGNSPTNCTQYIGFRASMTSVGTATGYCNGTYMSVTVVNANNSVFSINQSSGGNTSHFGIATSGHNTGQSVGMAGLGNDGKYNAGGIFQGFDPRDVAGNQAYGSRNLAFRLNGAMTNPTQVIGVYGIIAESDTDALEKRDPGVSAAAVFDNTTTVNDILNLRDNNVEKFVVEDGGTVDMSGISAGVPNFRFTATSDTPTDTWGTVTETFKVSAAPAGYVEISVGGNARYIPFWT